MNVSQPSEAFLFSTNGVSIAFFVDITNIPEGATLVRQLKRHGGTVVHTADDAQILLVDHDEPASVQLAAEWPNKLALHFSWVYRCINSGKYLGPVDEWAGFRVGSGAGTQQMIDVAQSPLPTPRQTPVSDFQTNALAAGSPLPTPDVLVPVVPNSANAAPLANLDATQLSQLTQYPLASLLPQYPPQVLQNLLVSKVTPAQIVQTLIEIAQRNGLATQQATVPHAQMSLTTSAFPSIQPDGGEQHQVSQSLDASEIPLQRNDVSEPRRRSHGEDDDTEADHFASRGVVISNGRHTSSKRRRVSHDARSPSTSRAYTGSGDDEPPLRLEARRQGSGSTPEVARQLPSARPSNTLFVKPDGQPMLFSVDMGVRNRNDLLADIKKLGGRIASEMNKADHVILNPHVETFLGRLKETLALGLPATSAQFVYDCMKTGVVQDSDSEKYSFDGVMTRPHKNRPSKEVNLEALRAEIAAPPTAPKRRYGKQSKMLQATKPSSRKKSTSPVSTQQPVPTIYSEELPAKPRIMNHPVQPEEETEVDTQTVPSRSPSPSPPTEVVKYVEGRNSFTDADKTFFMAYVQHILKYDPDTTQQKLATKLYEKAPHHTWSSWQSFAGRPAHRAAITHARNSGHIRVRNLQREASASKASHPSQTDRHVSQAALMSDYLLEDTMIMAEFLSKGVPDGVSDQDAYADLARRHPCRVAANWQEFWVKHHEVVDQYRKSVE